MGFDDNHSRDAWPGALAWYNFTEGENTTAADESGNGYDLTAAGSFSWGPTDGGYSGCRFSKGSYLSFGSGYATSANGLLDTYPTSFEIILRVRWSALTNNGRLFSKYGTDSRDPAYTGIDLRYNASGQLILTVGPTTGSTYFYFSLSRGFVVGRWYTIRVTRDGEKGTWALWIDDTLDQPPAVGPSPGPGTRNPFALGTLVVDGAASGNYGNIAVARARILSRILSDAEWYALISDESVRPLSVPEDRMRWRGIVINPDTGDQNIVVEPNAVWTPSLGIYEALVHCGWTGPSFFRYMHSPDGLTWTRGNNVLGNGVGGEPSDQVGRGSIVRKGGTYYKFYDDDVTGAGHGVYYATATAVSGPWTRQSLIIPYAAVASYGTYLVGPAALYSDRWDGWLMFAQVRCFDGQWRLVRFTGATLGAMVLDTTAGLLTDLDAAPAGMTGPGGYAAYQVDELADGRLRLWLHNSLGSFLPCQARVAYSSNGGRRWNQYPYPLRQLRGQVEGQDQGGADVCVVEGGPAGTLFLADCLNNPEGHSVIEAGTYPGTAEQWLAPSLNVDPYTNRIISASTTHDYLTSNASITDPIYVGGTVVTILEDEDGPSSMGGIEATIVAFQSTRLTKSWQIKKADGSRYDLTGHTFEFLVHEFEADGIVFFLSSGQFTLAPSSQDDESILDVITINATADQIDGSLLGKYQYKLRDTTIDLVLATGTFLVKLAPLV